MIKQPGTIKRHVFETRQLMAEHPPVWKEPNKRIIFEIACPEGSTHDGRLIITRWPAVDLPERVDLASAAGRLLHREGIYDYVPVAGLSDAMEWHVNFADHQLFAYYGGSLFAQDEIQVAEHPALGALKEALVAQGIPALTVENGVPTPVLVTGVERRCRVAIDPNAAEGRPRGLYGNAFARAEAHAVRAATSRIDPPTITNLIAMVAPVGRHGLYRDAEIRHILATAYTGFDAAMSASVRNAEESGEVVVHSGFWGCGAFGGHRVLMALLQILAAEMAGLTHLVLHTVNGAGTRSLLEAQAVLAELQQPESAVDMDELIKRIAARRYEWGVGDGN